MSAFDKVIGYGGIKKELEQIGDTLKNREIYRALGVASPRGLLLHGEPGVGKTLMATALIEESGRKAFVCRKDQPNGDFVRKIKSVFDEAAQHAPSIVFLDDMDKFANGDERYRDAEEYVTVQSCIDECRDKEVFVLATANSLAALPRSLIRSGRFDRVIGVRPPTGKDAETIIAHFLSGKKCVRDMDVPAIARIMNGRTCAQLETVINEAGMLAGYGRSSEITMDHFIAACLRVLYDIPEQETHDDDLDLSLCPGENDLRSQIVIHEAGHAAVSEILIPGSVTLVSIRRSTGSSAGMTDYCDPEDIDPGYKERWRIITALAGMAAVEQKIGVCDMGNSRDLDQAFRMTQDMIGDNCTFGFSLHSRMHGSSNDMDARLENAAAYAMEGYYRKAKEIIARNTAFFDKIAAALAKKGLLNYRDIQQIRETCEIVSVAV